MQIGIAVYSLNTKLESNKFRKYTQDLYTNIMILCIKTDSADAELYLYDNKRRLIDAITWYAHRELAVTLLTTVEKLVNKNKSNLSHLQGVVVYSGPGSFTGLRIGVSFANTLAYGLGTSVIGASGAEWIVDGLDQLDTFDDSNRLVVPNYGSDVHITTPRK